MWAGNVAKDLNVSMPQRYFAEPLAAFGFEIDVSAWEMDEERPAEPDGVPTWAPSEPADSLPIALLTDSIEVLVYRSQGGPTLAGAIEFVSPANKDRPDTRAAFVNKCAAYLQQGVGLIIVDIVTERRANLHRELLTRLVGSRSSRFAGNLYASAYRPMERDEHTCVDIWQERLVLGQSLPTLPLWLLNGPCMPVNLESTYERSWAELRMPTNNISRQRE
jgi:hypothetical protein